MTKFAAGSNLTGHPLIIFLNIMYLHSHPDLSLQARKATLFDIFSELYGGYGKGKFEKEIRDMRARFLTFQEDCISNIDGEREATPIVNTQRNSLDDIQLDLKKIIFDLEILKEAKYGMPVESEI